MIVITVYMHALYSELAGTVNHFSRLISNSKPINLTNFLRQIEESDSKEDFRVGIEARYNHMHVSHCLKRIIKVWGAKLENFL